MTTERILYTDGHEVTVTESFIKVKKSLYQLNGITRHSLFVIQPQRLVPFVIVVLGAIMIPLGALGVIPAGIIPYIHYHSIVMDANFAAVVLGCLMIFGGLTVMGLMRENYAIRISTAEGEKNLVVSPEKEYITQILDAMNHAFFNLVTSTREKARRVLKK